MGVVEGPEMERLGETLEPRCVGGKVVENGYLGVFLSLPFSFPRGVKTR